MLDIVRSIQRCRKTLWALALSATTLCITDAMGQTSGLRDIQLTLVDADATGIGTFQSHNQKVVSNVNGIFITYLHYFDDPSQVENIWRLARSTDGGNSFTTIYEGQNTTMGPAIETDEDYNIYLAFPQWYTGDDRFYFLRFLASEDYQTAHESIITDAWTAGKYAMAYDQIRQRFYIATQSGALFSVAPDGTLIDSTYFVWGGGPNGGPHYPHLHMGNSGTLYYAETSGDDTGLPDWAQYRSIHCLKSLDGGATWQRLDGTPVVTPVACDETGDATMISEMTELSRNTWLSNTLTKGGRTHFFYALHTEEEGTTSEPYMNYSVATGQRQHWRSLLDAGTQVETVGWDGFFATADLGSDSPLYVVMSDYQGGTGCLYSPDNGENWYDYALNTVGTWPYATGGARKLTADGYIIGTFTSPDYATGGDPQVLFLSIDTGVWVDFAYSGQTETGVEDEPFDTLAEALLDVHPGGIVRIKGDTAVSSKSETPTIDKRVTLTAVNGTVRIGEPGGRNSDNRRHSGFVRRD